MVSMSDADKLAAAPLPPPTFSFLALSLRTQAEMQLGLLDFGEEGKPEPNLALARHTIDMMAMLVEKTKGNLTIEEQRLIENSLTELRFRFVQVSSDLAKAQPAEQTSGA
jgi:hypothetical protein